MEKEAIKTTTFVGIALAILITVMTLIAVHVTNGVSEDVDWMSENLNLFAQNVREADKLMEIRLDSVDADIEKLAKSIGRLEDGIVGLVSETDVSCLYGAFPDDRIFVIGIGDVGPPPPEMVDMYLCGDGQRFYTFLPDGASVNNPLAAPNPPDNGIN